MEVGDVRVAEDTDFELLRIYLSRNDGWRQEYDKQGTKVWTRAPPEDKGAPFKMIRVRTVVGRKSHKVWTFIDHNKERETMSDRTIKVRSSVDVAITVPIRKIMLETSPVAEIARFMGPSVSRLACVIDATSRVVELSLTQEMRFLTT